MKKTFSQKLFWRWDDDDVSPCLKTGTGVLHGGGEVIVVDSDAGIDDSHIINSNGTGVSPTLDASYYKGQGFRDGAEREFVDIDISESDRMPLR